jgi:hypothetical protein
MYISAMMYGFRRITATLVLFKTKTGHILSYFANSGDDGARTNFFGLFQHLWNGNPANTYRSMGMFARRDPVIPTGPQTASNQARTNGFYLSTLFGSLFSEDILDAAYNILDALYGAGILKDYFDYISLFKSIANELHTLEVTECGGETKKQRTEYAQMRAEYEQKCATFVAVATIIFNGLRAAHNLKLFEAASDVDMSDSAAAASSTDLSDGQFFDPKILISVRDVFIPLVLEYIKGYKKDVEGTRVLISCTQQTLDMLYTLQFINKKRINSLERIFRKIHNECMFLSKECMDMMVFIKFI